MKVKINSQQRNPLLNRSEVTFEVDQEDIGGTPSRFEVRKSLASTIKTDVNLVFIEKMETKTGTLTTLGTANIYDSTDQAHFIEPTYIINRNSSPETPSPEEKKNE